MLLRQKAFLEEMNRRISKAVTALYDFAKNRDLIFSKEAEVSIGNGIIAEAILKGLDPTDDGQRKKAAKSLLGKVTFRKEHLMNVNPSIQNTVLTSIM